MKYILLLSISCAITFSHAQVRHVKGIRSLEAGGGMTKFGTTFYAGYINYFSNKVYGKYNLFFEKGRNLGLRYRSIGIDLSASYSLPPVKEFLYFNLRAGATSSLDQLTPPTLVFDESGIPHRENYATLKFGLFAGLETEMFLSDKLVLILGANQRYMFKSEFGKNRFFANAGIRYNL